MLSHSVVSNALIESESPASLALEGGFSTTAPRGKPCVRYFICINSQQPYEVDTTVVPILQMRKLRHKEVQSFAQSHSANNWQRGDSNLRFKSNLRIQISLKVNLRLSSIIYDMEIIE